MTTASGYPTSGGVTGLAVPYPLWPGGLFLPNTGDAGVVVLDTPVTLASYPTVAAVNYLDDLATARGRLKAWVQLVNLRSALDSDLPAVSLTRPTVPSPGARYARRGERP